jgi:hypothetical protein
MASLVAYLVGLEVCFIVIILDLMLTIFVGFGGITLLRLFENSFHCCCRLFVALEDLDS